MKEEISLETLTKNITQKIEFTIQAKGHLEDLASQVDGVAAEMLKIDLKRLMTVTQQKIDRFLLRFRRA